MLQPNDFQAPGRPHQSRVFFSNSIGDQSVTGFNSRYRLLPKCPWTHTHAGQPLLLCFTIRQADWPLLAFYMLYYNHFNQGATLQMGKIVSCLFMPILCSGSHAGEQPAWGWEGFRASTVSQNVLSSNSQEDFKNIRTVADCCTGGHHYNGIRLTVGMTCFYCITFILQSTFCLVYSIPCCCKFVVCIVSYL